MIAFDFKSINFQEIITTIFDIGIITFLIHRVFILLSRTRSLQLMQGVVVILVGYVATNYLNLTTTSWLLRNISSYLVFVLIVILQPEMRNLLSMIGKGSIFDWLQNKKIIPINEIVKAVQSMASKKIGSTIVILQNIRPQNIIERAVNLNSKVTAELIETIFWKESPLHDGALIIEGERILAASCYLPLSETRLVDKTSGARHRSALGMVEESDAIVIVTSEETGSITIFYDGEMKKVISKEIESSILHLLYERKNHNIFSKGKFK